MRKWLILISILCMLTGCSNLTKENDYHDVLHEIEQALDKKEWDSVVHLTEKLNDLYNKTDWEIELLGDEEELEGLENSIKIIHTSAKLKDETNTYMELTKIKTYLKNIYTD